MRSLLVCCLAVLAVASTQVSGPKPFAGQKTYVYRFDTQVSTSLIGASPAEIQQAAATRLRADAILSFTNERHAKLQLQHIRIGELNSELPKSQRVQPLEHFERRDLSQDLKQTLEMPLSVSLVDGVVERINFHEEDSTWAKNIKRAVLNMIQLNLKRNDVQGLKMQSSMPEQDKDVPVFSVPEITLEGECEAVYTIQKSQKYGDEDEQTPFNVTKTINFNKCQRTADLSYGYSVNPAEQLRCFNCLRQQKFQQQDALQIEQSRYGHCQSECQPNKINEDKDVDRSTFGRFELVGKQEKYAIKRASMLSNYVVKAQNPGSQNTLIQVVALSELTFKEQLENDAQKVPSFKQSSTDETLMYSPEWDLKEKRFYMYGDEEEKQTSPFQLVQKKEQKAGHAVKSILRQWQDKSQGYELDSALHFNRLVEILRQSSVKEIKQIEQALKQVVQEQGQNQGQEQEQELVTPEHSIEQAMSLFQDALAAAATRNTLYVLADKIMKQDVSATKAVQLLKAFVTNQHSPSERQADLLEKIAQHEISHRSPALKQTAWLSFGQTVGAICQDKPAEGQKQMFRVEEICSRGKKDEYKKTLMQEWKKVETVYEQILVLKVIGNAALDNMVNDIQKIVMSNQQPTLVRMEAIDALRRLRTSMPREIRQILLPIFQNQREQPEIRMAAFSMIMYTHPEKSILDQLTFTTINDRSQNVKSFVLTTMDALAKSPSSAEQEISNHMRAALKMVKLEPEDMRSSRKYRVPIYVSEQENTEEQNIFLSLASIVSPSNMLPIHLSTSLRSAFNGEATEENLQLSFTQKNLEQWYEKLAQYVEQSGSGNNEDQSTERQSAKDLRSIYSSLGIKNRRQGSYYLSSEESDEQQTGQGKQGRHVGAGEPFGMIVIRTNDVDSVIVPISEQQLPRIVQQLIKGEKPSLMSQYEQFSQQLSAGKHFRQHLALIGGEKRTKIPTTSGLPLSLTRQTSTVLSVDGNLKVRFESENLDASRGMTAELKLRTSGIASHLHRAEVWSPVVISGVESVRTVELNLPVELKLRADKTKVELKTKLPQDNQKLRFFAIHTLPITFTQAFEMSTRTHRERRVKAVHNWALEHTQRERHQNQQNQVGQAIQIEGHYHHVTSPIQILQAMYTTENNVHFYFVANDRTPKELTLRIIGSAFEKHSEHSRPELDSFYSSNSGFKQIYSEDEGIDMEQDRENRKSSLSTYSQQYQSKDAYKHQLRIEAEAHCGPKTHKIYVELKGACDSRVKHCKVFVEAERSPLSSENSPWTLKAKIQTVMPEISGESEELDNKQVRLLINTEANWGSEQQSKMNVRIQGEPTRKTYWKSGSQDKWSRFLNKYDMVAEYKLQSNQKNLVNRFFELMKAQLFWQLSVEDRRSNEDGIVRATVVIDPITRRHANISIQTPTERLRAQSIELPTRFSPYSLTRKPSNVRSIGHLIQSVTNYGGAECRVSEDRIKTFDGVAYKAPMSECWSVLAKDCSRDSPRFVVLGKKTEQEKKVKIIMNQQNTIIELISKSENSKPTIKINGQVVTDEEKLSERNIETSYNQVYFRQGELNVQFDGEEVKIKVSGMLKGLQCGLCGHYNDEEEDVFRMSDNKRSSSLKQFHQSYVLKNEECDQTKLNKFYEDQGSQEFSIDRRSKNQGRRQQQKNSWFDSDESQNQSEENYDEDKENKSSMSGEQSGRRTQNGRGNRNQPEPIKRTKVIEYQQKICFSTEPVKRCPKGSSPNEDSQTNQVQVKFFCLERSSTEARRLLRQVREGKTVQSEGQSQSFVEQVEEPTRCQTVY